MFERSECLCETSGGSVCNISLLTACIRLRIALLIVLQLVEHNKAIKGLYSPLNQEYKGMRKGNEKTCAKLRHIAQVVSCVKLPQRRITMRRTLTH